MTDGNAAAQTAVSWSQFSHKRRMREGTLGTDEGQISDYRPMRVLRGCERSCTLAPTPNADTFVCENPLP